MGVWVSVAGSLSILLRSRFAGSAFGLTLLGLIATQVYTFAFAPASALLQPGAMTLLFTAAILLILLATMLYARAQTRASRLS